MAFTAEFPSQPQATTSGLAQTTSLAPAAPGAPDAPRASQIPVRHDTHRLVVGPGRTITSERWEPAGGDIQQTVFLLSGVGHWSALWQASGEHLAQHGIRAIAINFRGHGRGDLYSQWDHDVSWATFGGFVTDTTRAIADAAQEFGLAPGQYSVAGHSMGGGVAILYASQAPVQRLLLVGSCAMSMWLGIYLRIMRPIVRTVGMNTLLDATFQGADAFFIDRKHPHDTRRIRHTLFDETTDPADVACVLDRLGRESKWLMPAFFRYATPWQRRAIRAALARNTQDMAIIGFERDVFFPPAAIDATAHEYGMGGNRRVIIPDAPHDGFADRRYAPQFFAALRGLLLGEQAQEQSAGPADDLADDSASDLAHALPHGMSDRRGEE